MARRELPIVDWRGQISSGARLDGGVFLFFRAAYITTRQFLISHLVGSIAGAAIGSIGAVALMLHVQETPTAGRAIAGMAAMIAGNTLTTAVFGAAALAQPAMGRMFLAGQSNAQEFYNQVYAAPLFLSVFSALLTVASVAVAWNATRVSSTQYAPA